VRHLVRHHFQRRGAVAEENVRSPRGSLSAELIQRLGDQWAAAGAYPAEWLAEVLLQRRCIRE
jgi:hypothetical protein